jgi:hypothetical protein
MTPFAYRSSGKDGRRIGFAACMLLLAGSCCLLVGGFGAPGKAVYQGIFVLCLMAAIFLWVRFLLTAYTVECREENGDMCLYIVQVTGRRMQTLAIFELSRIAALRRYPAGEKPDKKEGKLLSYTTAIFSESVILTVESVTLTAPTLVRLEASEEFFSRLEPLITVARAGQGYDPAAKYTEKTEDMDCE